ncbi:carbohydrate ABC transporter permease [Arachnia propionica]|uniref:Sugar ABC transporter permease n=1 Tax=Arachnia propionica TaxID=1750 RepID=A0A3P1WQW0_9ACTN|nr:sugar ABC transporter permease [Arachnia propionica]RRD48999.1 sugar ABC transporter permease [Arachnia propionica]
MTDTPKTPLRRRPVEPIYWFFLLPALLAFTLLVAYPAIEGLVMSFTNSIGFGDFKVVGLRNYIALFQDENILASYGFTFLFAITTVILVNVIAFFLALALTANIKLKTPLRAIYVIPMVISAIIYSFVFKFLFNNSLPQVAQALGIESLSTSLLANEGLAWFAVVLVTTWGSVPSALLIYIAGLTTIPGEVYEAGSIDGATGWQKLRHITLPLVVGYIGINMVVGLKNYMQVYDQIVALTAGGPGTATRSVAFTIFDGFNGGDYAYQMANAAVFFVIALVIAGIQLRFTQRSTDR